MVKLTTPSRELVMRVLTAVDFGHRLSGFILRERTGALAVSLYSFQETVSFLNDPYARVDFNELEKWVRETMNDQELAEQIAGSIRNGRSDRARSLHIRKWMEERLKQCQRLVGRG